jgi:HSP20 family protein
MALPVRQDASTLTRMDPWREFENLTGQMNQLLESTFGQSGLASAAGWAPAVDVEETEDAYRVEAELPGVHRDAVQVEVGGGVLTITGEFKERERTGVLRRRTRRTGRFEFRTTLPAAVDSDKISASLQDGALSVNVPKAAEAKPRRVEITAG